MGKRRGILSSRCTARTSCALSDVLAVDLGTGRGMGFRQPMLAMAYNVSSAPSTLLPAPTPRLFFTFRLEARSAAPPGSPYPQLPPNELAALVLQLAEAPTTGCYRLKYDVVVQPGQLGRAFDRAVYFVPDPDVRPYAPGDFPDTGLPVNASLGELSVYWCIN